MWDVVIAAFVVTPPVLAGVWLLLRSVARATNAAAAALLTRVECPLCRARPLEWRGTVWEETVLHDDGDEPAAGFVFHCPRCGGEFRFTDGGEHHVPTADAG